MPILLGIARAAGGPGHAEERVEFMDWKALRLWTTLPPAHTGSWWRQQWSLGYRFYI